MSKIFCCVCQNHRNSGNANVSLTSSIVPAPIAYILPGLPYLTVARSFSHYRGEYLLVLTRGYVERRGAWGSARLMPPREKIERNATDPGYRPHPIVDDAPREEATTRGSYLYRGDRIYLISAPIVHGIPRLRILIPRTVISTKHCN